MEGDVSRSESEKTSVDGVGELTAVVTYCRLHRGWNWYTGII